MLTVYITNPRKIWQVDQVRLPDLSFFSNKTSLQLAKLPESQVHTILFREWNKFAVLGADGWRVPGLALGNN